MVKLRAEKIFKLNLKLNNLVFLVVFFSIHFIHDPTNDPQFT